ncbi:MAG: hypothetical protein ACP5QI_06935, partial [Candidatus Bathyarchaeia archaeon]
LWLMRRISRFTVVVEARASPSIGGRGGMSELLQVSDSRGAAASASIRQDEQVKKMAASSLRGW